MTSVPGIAPLDTDLEHFEEQPSDWRPNCSRLTAEKFASLPFAEQIAELKRMIMCGLLNPAETAFFIILLSVPEGSDPKAFDLQYNAPKAARTKPNIMGWIDYLKEIEFLSGAPRHPVLSS